MVEIISSIAQKIKDFIVDKFDLEEEDEEDLFEEETTLEEEEFEDKSEEKRELEELEKEEDDIIIREIPSKHQPAEIANEAEENVFDLKDLSHKLEEELEHSLEAEKEKELEDLIIKEAYKNLN